VLPAKLLWEPDPDAAPAVDPLGSLLQGLAAGRYNACPSGSGRPRGRDFARAVEKSYLFVLAVGSAWESSVPWPLRYSFLQHAHYLEMLLERAQDRRSRFGYTQDGPPRYRGSLDLNALGTPDPVRREFSA
jgi:hypothetical protein